MFVFLLFLLTPRQLLTFVTPKRSRWNLEYISNKSALLTLYRCDAESKYRREVTTDATLKLGKSTLDKAAPQGSLILKGVELRRIHFLSQQWKSIIRSGQPHLTS